jgi:general secretion pathway protein A
MYKEYFHLKEMPFSIAPDPRFLFMSERYREALAHLLFGIQGEGGIVLLTGEVGTGKTTICRSLLEQLPANVDVAYILNPRMSVEELLETICDEYHVAVPEQRRGLKGFVDAIHARLLEGNAQGRRSVLIIDEAQNLEPEVVEQLRLLTNLETNTHKLLHIILIGQPELQELLARPEMRQVLQRVVARYHLGHLDAAEVRGYVAHRLSVSGAASAIFPDSLVKPLFRATDGVPRLINLVCDRALLGAYTQGLQQVSWATLRQAIHEVAAARQPVMHAFRGWWPAMFVLAFAAAGLVLVGSNGNPPPSDTAAPAVASPLAADKPDVQAVLPFSVTLDRLTWPDDVPREDSERLAYRSLFGLFGLAFDPKRDALPCRQAEAYGMRCFRGQGGLPTLRLIDQPAILSVTEGGAPVLVTLIGLEAQFARVALAGVERRVSLGELVEAWDGDFVLLWRPPAAFGTGLVPNQQSAAVAWLRESLARIDGRPAGSGTVFDADLAGRVRRFQLAEGMPADGLVGSRTAIRLNVRSGAGGPRLVADLKD